MAKESKPSLSRSASRCKHCKEKFTAEERAQARRLHDECVDPWMADQRLKAFQQALQPPRRKPRKPQEKSVHELKAECLEIAQAIARIRDRNDGCISCDKPATWDGQWHGSHYRAVGGCSSLALNLWNIHKGCSQCNHFQGGNIAGYTPRLVAKVGQARVDWIKSQPKSVKRSKDYFIKYKRVMGKRLRRMEKRSKA